MFNFTVELPGKSTLSTEKGSLDSSQQNSKKLELNLIELTIK